MSEVISYLGFRYDLLIFKEPKGRQARPLPQLPALPWLTLSNPSQGLQALYTAKQAGVCVRARACVCARSGRLSQALPPRTPPCLEGQNTQEAQALLQEILLKETRYQDMELALFTSQTCPSLTVHSHFRK